MSRERSPKVLLGTLAVTAAIAALLGLGFTLSSIQLPGVPAGWPTVVVAAASLALLVAWSVLSSLASSRMRNGASVQDAAPQLIGSVLCGFLSLIVMSALG